MVDFTTPDLCGASEQFNKLAGQFASIKDSLQDQLEGEIDALKSELPAHFIFLVFNEDFLAKSGKPTSRYLLPTLAPPC